MIYPPTKIYFIRLITFSPSIENAKEKIHLEKLNLVGLNTKNLNYPQFKDKVIFMNFWATWCPPCIAEMPSMQKLYNDYHDKVQFLFITNETIGEVEKFYLKRGFNFPTYNLNSAIPEKLSSNTIPTTYIIYKNKIYVNKIGAANWNSDEIRNLLDRLVE